MKDYFFYPLCLILSLLMVGAALAPGFGRLPETPMSGDGTYEGYLSLSIAGKDLNRIRSGGPTDISLNQEADPWYLRIGHEAGRLGSGYDEGAYFPLGPDFEVQYGGFETTITLEVAPAKDWGARAFEVMYATGLQENSGWRRFDLVPETRAYSFTYTPPPFNGVLALDYLAIRPVVERKQGYIRVEKVTFSKK